MNHLELAEKKIMPIDKLIPLRKLWKFKDESVVFTNGCFDLMHKGHIHSLTQAASFGKHLIVAVNSDSSIQRIKKAGRPIQDEHSRALVLAALSCVDAVVLFNEDTPLQLIKTLLPDVLVKGGDYTIENIVGANEVMAHGGRVEIIPIIEGYSTTAIESKIKSNL